MKNLPRMLGRLMNNVWGLGIGDWEEIIKKRLTPISYSLLIIPTAIGLIGI